MNINNKYNEFIKLNSKYEGVAVEFSDYLYNIKDIYDLKHYSFSDRLHELADGLVDVYNQDLLNWVESSHEVRYINDAVDEYGMDANNFDFYDLIKMGQYQYYYELVNELYNDFIDFLEN